MPSAGRKQASNPGRDLRQGRVPALPEPMISGARSSLMQTVEGARPATKLDKVFAPLLPPAPARGRRRANAAHDRRPVRGLARNKVFDVLLGRSAPARHDDDARRTPSSAKISAPPRGARPGWDQSPPGAGWGPSTCGARSSCVIVGHDGTARPPPPRPPRPATGATDGSMRRRRR